MESSTSLVASSIDIERVKQGLKTMVGAQVEDFKFSIVKQLNFFNTDMCQQIDCHFASLLTKQDRVKSGDSSDRNDQLSLGPTKGYSPPRGDQFKPPRIKRLKTDSVVSKSAEAKGISPSSKTTGQALCPSPKQISLVAKPTAASPQSAINEMQATSLEDGELPQSSEDARKPRHQRSSGIIYFRIIRLQCTVNGCYDMLQTPEELNEHIHKVHHMKQFACPRSYCFLRFFRKDQLLRHLEHEHSSVEVKCQKCGEQLNSPNSEYSHQVFHHEKGIFACAKDGCPFKNNCRNVVVRHFRSYHQTNMSRPWNQSRRAQELKRKTVEDSEDKDIGAHEEVVVKSVSLKAWPEHSSPLLKSEQKSRKLNRGPSRFRFSRDSLDRSYGF